MKNFAKETLRATDRYLRQVKVATDQYHLRRRLSSITKRMGNPLKLQIWASLLRDLKHYPEALEAELKLGV
ncbi:MAG TPA: hypothetical protein ENI23_06965 [bacterium]|nr:hypothetical protein [bacterium]